MVEFLASYMYTEYMHWSADKQMKMSNRKERGKRVKEQRTYRVNELNQPYTKWKWSVAIRGSKLVTVLCFQRDKRCT